MSGLLFLHLSCRIQALERKVKLLIPCGELYQSLTFLFKTFIDGIEQKQTKDSLPFPQKVTRLFSR